MTEIWKEIENYEGYYQVSNLGRIKSLKRTIEGGHGTRTVNERILVLALSKHGYLKVILRKFGIDKSFPVHRLVATAFITNSHNLPVVNHLNGIKIDNKVSNLEWCSHSYNTKHAIATKLVDIDRIINMGYNNSISARLKVRQLDKKTRKEIKIFESLSEASRTMSIPLSNIVNVCKGNRNSAGGYGWQYV